MGIFNIFKKRETTQELLSEINNNSAFNYYKIKEVKPNIKIEEFTKETSLILYLKSIKFSDEQLAILKENNYETTTFLNILIGKLNDISYSTYKKASLSEKAIPFKILTHDYESIPELLAAILIFGLSSQFAVNDIINNTHCDSLEYFKQQVREIILHPDNIELYPLLINKDLASCIAVYQISSGSTLNDIFFNIIKYLENNCKEVDLFRLFPTSLIENMIAYNLENMYTKNKLSISFLFKKNEKLKMDNFINPVFDVRIMQQCKYDSNYYIINEAYKDKCKNDLLSLNKYINEAASILKCDLTLILEHKLIFNPRDEGYSKLKFTPLTRTGKAAKFPYELFFITQSDLINGFFEPQVLGTVSYLNDGSIGKAEFTSWIYQNGYTLNLVMKNNSLILNRITTFNDGTRVVVYKYEDNNICIDAH